MVKLAAEIACLQTHLCGFVSPAWTWMWRTLGLWGEFPTVVCGPEV